MTISVEIRIYFQPLCI